MYYQDVYDYSITFKNKTLRLISLKRKIEDDFPIHIRMSMWDPYRTRKSVYEHAG